MCDTNSDAVAQRNANSDGVRKKVQEAWNNGREIIRNENDLINQRMTTFLTFQGFLFAGSAVLVTNALGKAPPVPTLTFTSLFMLLVGSFIGFIACYRTQLHVQAAARHIEATSLWWTKFIDKENEKFRQELPFPIMIGTLGKPALIPWTMQQYLKEHRDAIEDHHGKLLRAPLIDKNEKERVVNPSDNIVGSLPRILRYVWGFSFPISLGAFIYFIYNHIDDLGRHIHTFFSGQ